MAIRPRLRMLLIILLTMGALVALVWALSRNKFPFGQETAVKPPAPLSSPAEMPTPVEDPGFQPPPSTTTASPEATATPLLSPLPSGSTMLVIPVAGVRPNQLRDTFTASRSEERSHDAIDIPAARGTPVLAAADGKIVKLWPSVPGGITIYQLGLDNRTVYYYAHLERYADGLAENSFVRQGEVIGYVGDTGNAGPGNYHLHFSVSIVSDPKRYWEGVNINPYPLLSRNAP